MRADEPPTLGEMMNTAQMDTIPLSSDSESGNDPPRPNARQPSPPNPPSDEEEEPVTPTSRLSSMPARHTPPSGPQLDAKTTLGPTPDLIPRSEADSSPSRGRESDGPPCTAGDCDAPEGDEEADEEKQRLIAQVLELQHTLEDLSARVDSVKEENLKLRSENQILGQYIENLMAASSVFQSSTPRMRRKASGPAGASKAAVLKLQQQE